MNRWLLTISCILVLGGVMLLLSTESLGVTSADAWMLRHGGSAATSTYEAVLNGAMASYRTMGAILFGAGLLGALQCLRGNSR